jgi:hypothetical protein
VDWMVRRMQEGQRGLTARRGGAATPSHREKTEMPQTAVSMAQVQKEAWTADRLQKQFEDKNIPLGKIESIRGTMIGRQAQTPVWGGRSGASTSVGAAGGNLNAAQQQPTAQALWTLVYNWFQIELDTSAIAQASGQSVQSIVGGKDLEIEGAIENQKHQMSRMLVTGGDGVVAACDTTASSNTIKLVNAAGEGTALRLLLARARLALPRPARRRRHGRRHRRARDRGRHLGGRLLQPGGADHHGRRRAVRHHARDALRLHPQPQLADGAEPGAERHPADHRLGRARRPQRGDGRPGVLARRVP